MSALLIGSQPGRVFIGFLALGIFVDGDALVGIVKDAPHYLHPRDLGRPRPGLGLGLGLLDRLLFLFRRLFLIRLFVFYFRSFFIDFTFLLVLIPFFFLFLFDLF